MRTTSHEDLFTAAFLQRLRELAWVEDRTITVTYRWAEGSSERAAEIAADLVPLGFDVIVTSAPRSSSPQSGSTEVVRLRHYGDGRP